MAPWLFDRRTDLLAFGGSFLLALLLVGLGASSGILDQPLPLPFWLVLVVGVDVAHVHSTWLRTYLDPRELKTHPWRYALVPVGCFAVGAAVHAFGSLPFWRMLAYLAVFHFVRQQAGWVSLYQRMEPDLSPWDRRLDRAAIYSATLWPLLWWHAHLPRPFTWFVAGDFAALVPGWLPGLLLPLHLGLLGGFLLRFLVRGFQGKWAWGKGLVVATTALAWHLGIVRWQSDLAFTALNVLPHGVPYMVLVWRPSAAEAPRGGWAGRLLAWGPLATLGLLLAVAFGEEWLWDLGIWHDHPALFGEGWNLSPLAQAFLVPLLALPQATHYVLDGFIWKRTR